MGFDHNTAKFVLYCHQQGVDFSSTLTLGRQCLHVTQNELASLLTRAGHPSAPLSEIYDTYCEPFLRFLGAKEVDSLDANSYENATLIHDMNLPITVPRQYSTVIDSGTMEHVFNVGTFIQNAMKLVKVGGHYISMVPMNNWVGHGFYQFSPEFFYRALDTQYGFKVKKLFVCETHWRNRWMESPDATTIGHRLTLVNNNRSYVLVLAQKLEEKDGFSGKWPQQTEYEQLEWRGKKANDQVDFGKIRKKALYHAPDFARGLINWIRAYRMRGYNPNYRVFRPF